MPIGWMTVLQSVPWTEVVRNAPKVAAGAKKLWSTLGKRNGESAASELDSSPPAEPLTLAQMQERLAVLQTSTVELRDRLIESSRLIDALAEQNTQLIASTQTLSRRLKGLTWVLGLVVVVGGWALWLR